MKYQTQYKIHVIWKLAKERIAKKTTGNQRINKILSNLTASDFI